MAAKTGTYTLIASSTLGSGAATVTFSSIPGTYTDLILVCKLLASSTANNSDGLRFQLNGDTATNYSATWLTNSTTTPVSSRESSATRGRFGNVSQTTNDVGTAIGQFLDYANTTTYKTMLGRSGNLNSNGDSNVFAAVSMWRSTAAVTQIVLSQSSNANFVTGSNFKLYGIEAAK
jgi:hypothetical protein